MRPRERSHPGVPPHKEDQEAVDIVDQEEAEAELAAALRRHWVWQYERCAAVRWLRSGDRGHWRPVVDNHRLVGVLDLRGAVLLGRVQQCRGSSRPQADTEDNKQR